MTVFAFEFGFSGRDPEHGLEPAVDDGADNRAGDDCDEHSGADGSGDDGRPVVFGCDVFHGDFGLVV